jgi:hypothetical protein
LSTNTGLDQRRRDTIVGRSRIVSGAFVTVLLLVGCSGNGSDDDKTAETDRTTTTTTTTTTAPAATTTTIDLAMVDTAKVDAVIGEAIRATQLLTLPAGPGTEVLTAYTQAADAFDRQAQALAGGIAGVPESITAAGVRTFRNVATTVRAQVTCFRNQGSAKVSDKPCADETTAATNGGLAAGASLLVLIPYGTRSHEEVVAALRAPPG